MPPRKQKVIASKPRKASRPRKRQPVTPAPEAKTERLLLKFKLNPNAYKDLQAHISKHQNSLGAADVDENAENDDPSFTDGQGMRRGVRQRRKVHRPDMAFGSEMDHLIMSSVGPSKVEAGEDVHMDSSPRQYLIRNPEMAANHG